MMIIIADGTTLHSQKINLDWIVEEKQIQSCDVDGNCLACVRTCNDVVCTPKNWMQSILIRRFQPGNFPLNLDVAHRGKWVSVCEVDGYTSHGMMLMYASECRRQIRLINFKSLAAWETNNRIRVSAKFLRNIVPNTWIARLFHSALQTIIYRLLALISPIWLQSKNMKKYKHLNFLKIGFRIRSERWSYDLNWLPSLVIYIYELE